MKLSIVCATRVLVGGMILVVAGAAPAVAEPGVLVRLWFVQFDPAIDTSNLPLDIRALHQSHPEHAPMLDGRIQTQGLARQLKLSELSVTAGGQRLMMRAGELVTVPVEAGGATRSIEVLTAPRLLLELGQQGALSVGKPVSYMVRREDGCLVVESDAAAVEGAEVTLTVKRADEQEIRFEDIQLKVTRVSQRQPVDGVPFDVGRPVLDTRQTSLGLSLEKDHVGVIPLPLGPGDAPILVFITASRDGRGS